MNSTLTLTTERVDDIPLLLAQMQQMNLPALMTDGFPTHGNWNGLDLGRVAAVWLAFILSQGDHRLSHVQPWASHRMGLLTSVLGCAVTDLDWSDDRLAAVLRLLSDDDRWAQFEAQLASHLVCAYALSGSTDSALTDSALTDSTSPVPTPTVRIDTTTASGYYSVTEGGLFQFGPSKDHRPDLPQLKVALATLDPLGLPIATDVVAGHRADDPLYIPSIQRVKAGLGATQTPTGRPLFERLLFVGDAKMGALRTRAFITAEGDRYLCPLSKTQCSEAQMRAYLASAAAQTPTVVCDGEGHPVAWAFEQTETVEATTAEAQSEKATSEKATSGKATSGKATSRERLSWRERRVVVRSLALAEAAHKRLEERLQRTEAELVRLGEPKRGKPPWTDEAAIEAAAAAILRRYKADGLLCPCIQPRTEQRAIRAYGGRAARIEEQTRFTVTVERNAEALAACTALLGWRVYATTCAELTLHQVVWTYRSQHRIEQNFHRLKGHPLSLTPMYLQRDDHVTGLVRLLSVALRVLVVMESAVRQKLAAAGEEALAGLYAGNAKRATRRPTAERLLAAFVPVTLTVIPPSGERPSGERPSGERPSGERPSGEEPCAGVPSGPRPQPPARPFCHVTPLTPLQHRILELLELPSEIYTGLCTESDKPS